MKRIPYIIGLCGNSGSGKTYIADKLAERFTDDELIVLKQDNYYKPLDQQPLDKNREPNFDRPESLFLKSFVEDIRKLKGGDPIIQNMYTYNKPRKNIFEKIKLSPAPLIIIEGIFIFHTKELDELFDLKIFVDSDIELQIERRIRRDSEERGYDKEDVLYKFEHHIEPMIDEFIMPQKRRADIIIQNFNDPSRAIDIIADHMGSIL